MSYGIALLSVIPCRAASNDRSEIVTQLLFGEHYTVLEETPKWIRIKIQGDGYEGWICRKQFSVISESIFNQLNTRRPSVCDDFIANVSPDNENHWVTMGATLPLLTNGCVHLGNKEFLFSGKIAQPDSKNIVSQAMRYLNTPYLWGGRSPFGIDCSGFVQVVFKLCGIQLPRDASQQAEIGADVSFIETAKPGDLAFFDNEEGHITHVGVVIDPNTIIHASGKVRIDTIDHQGIYNAETKKYSHQLRIIKRCSAAL